MYAMPMEKLSNGKYRIFFEETSLVGRGKRRLTFAECKERAYKRLAYHGIEGHSSVNSTLKPLFLPRYLDSPDRHDSSDHPMSDAILCSSDNFTCFDGSIRGGG
jgi:hypothetical protein